LEIFFNDLGHLIGGQITNFLLEKARVVSQAQGERNFHIFYQLFTDQKLCKELYLQSQPQHYRYLNQSGVLQQTNDASDFVETRQAMTAIGMTAHEQSIIFGCVAAILHIGNINFRIQGEQTVIANPELLDPIARLLSLDVKLLSNSMTSKFLEIGGSRGSSITVGLTVAEAEFARDALVRSFKVQINNFIRQREFMIDCSRI
jgi:myosin-1